MKNWRQVSLILLVMGLCVLTQAQSPYTTITGTLQGANGLPAANSTLSFTPTQSFFVPAGGPGNCNGFIFQVNAALLNCGDILNFNNASPAAPVNGINVTWQNVRFGSIDSISAAIVGNGNIANCLSGIGTWVACSGGGGGIVGPTLNGGLAQAGSTLGLLTTCSFNQVEQWNGASWVCATISGGGTPGGSLNQIQFNNSVFGGIANVAKGSFLVSQGTGATPVFQTKPIVDVRDQGFVVGGSTDNTSAANTLIAAIGTTQTTVSFPGGTYLLGNISWPANITLDFTEGGAITCTNSDTVTILGGINATPDHQIFNNCNAGQGTVVFTANAHNGSTTIVDVYPEWWGAFPDGDARSTVSADAAGIQSAIIAAFGNTRTNASFHGIYNRTLWFSGLYFINAELKCYHMLGFRWQGVNRLFGGIVQTATNLRIIDGQSDAYGSFEDMTFQFNGTVSSSPLVDLDYSGAQGTDVGPQFIDFKHVTFVGSNVTDTGILIAKSGGGAQGSNIYCWDCSFAGFTGAGFQIGGNNTGRNVGRVYAPNAIENGLWGGDMQSNPLYGVAVYGGNVQVHDVSMENGFTTQALSGNGESSTKVGYDVYCEGNQGACIVDNVRSESRKLVACETCIVKNSYTIDQAQFVTPGGGDPVGFIMRGCDVDWDGQYYQVTVDGLGGWGGIGTCASPIAATSGSSTTIVSSGASWTSNAFVGMYVAVLAGTNGGCYATVTSNTSTTITASAGWLTKFYNLPCSAPDATSTFVVEPGWNGGTVTSGGMTAVAMNEDMIGSCAGCTGATVTLENVSAPGGKLYVAARYSILNRVDVTRPDWFNNASGNGPDNNIETIVDMSGVVVGQVYSTPTGAAYYQSQTFATNGANRAASLPFQKRVGTSAFVWGCAQAGGGLACDEVGIGGRSTPVSGDNHLEIFAGGNNPVILGPPAAFGTNVAGINAEFGCGRSTGSAAGGLCEWLLTAPGSSGTSVNAESVGMTLGPNGLALSSLSSSTNSICANGAGGALTTTGCGGNATSLLGSPLAPLPGSLANLCWTGSAWSYCSGGTGTVTVVGSGSLTSTAIVTGGGTTTLQTPSATSTLSSGGNMSLAGTLGVTGLTTLTGGGVIPSGATLTVPTGGIITFSGSGEINATHILGAAIPSLPGSLECLTYTGAAWAFASCSGGGGSGTVTSFSAGNLSPLFTSSVATAPSTPALTFTLTSAAGDTAFGNCSGTSGAPSYCWNIGAAANDIPQLNGSGLLLASEIPNATSGAIGGIELGGDIGGSATTPTVVNGSNITNSSIPNSGLVHPSTTVNSQTCTLGSACTIPFQTNTVNNTSQAGINLKPSTVNASGLTVTPTNTGTNVDTFEITGTVLGSKGGTGLNTSSSTGIGQVNSGTWFISAALANATTATTQSIGDSSLDVATDQFVLQNAFTNPCTLLGCTVYGGSGGSATALNGPTGPNGVPQIYISVPSGGLATAPAWAIPGTPIDAQTGTTPYAIPVTDDVHFVYESTTSTSAVAWTGFTLANNYVFSFANYGTGEITFTPASGTVNGAATQIIPTNYFGFHYTDNTNTFMPVMPTIAAFPSCSGASNALTFTTTTGAFGCNSISGGGSSAFASITGGTNTSAAMIVGTGASLATSGSGTIAATSAPFSGIIPGTNTASTAWSINPASALGGTAADFSVLGAPSETDTAAVVNIDTASGSTQPSLRVGANGGMQLEVCSGLTVIGNVVGCSSIGAPNTAKFVVDASGATVQLAREWQSSAAFTSTLNLWNSATTAGTGFAFLQAFAGVTSTDTTSGGGTKVFEVLGNGSIDVGTWNSTVIASQYGGTGANFNSSTGVLTFASGVASVGALPLTSLATQAANTTLANVTGSTAVPTAAAIPAGVQFYTSGTGYSAATSANLLGVCTTCVTSSSPGLGIAHFAGSTQAVTSSAVSLTADVTGILPFVNMAQSWVVNAQTATYQVLAADFAGCKTIPVASGTFTITLVASGSQPASGQCIEIVNYGSGVVTVARSGQNINGAAANLTLAAGSASAPTGVFIVSDGTNYVADTQGGSSGGSGTVTVVSSGSLTSTALVTGGGTTTLQTPSATATLSSGGALSIPGTIGTGTVPTVTTPGSGFYIFGTEGTEPVSIAASTDGFVFDSTSHCPIQWNNAANVGCSAALGAIETFTAAQTFSAASTFTGGVINTTTPIRDQTRFVLVANMTATATAGVNLGSTGAGNSVFSWPVTAANWYDLSCKLPVTFAASATISFKLVSISGAVTISNVNSETMGNTAAAAAFQDLTTIAGTSLAGSATTVTGAPGASETITYSSQFLTSHAGNIGLAFVGNATNTVQPLLGGQCGLTQIN